MDGLVPIAIGTSWPTGILIFIKSTIYLLPQAFHPDSYRDSSSPELFVHFPFLSSSVSSKGYKLLVMVVMVRILVLIS